MPVRERDPGRRGVEALPPHSSIAGLAHVGEHSVFGDGGHGVRVGLVGGAGGHAEETVLRVDGSQLPCRDTRGTWIQRAASRESDAVCVLRILSPPSLTLTVELHPRNVVAHTLHLPAGQSWFHHGQVGFTTGTGEGRRHVALHPLRVGDAQDLREERG